MAANDEGGEIKFHIWGWILFVICAVFYMASSIESRSMLSLAGSIVFLVACIVFMIPLVKKARER